MDLNYDTIIKYLVTNNTAKNEYNKKFILTYSDKFPPKFTELPDLNSVETKKTQENVGNQENIDKLKKMLQESD